MQRARVSGISHNCNVQQAAVQFSTAEHTHTLCTVVPLIHILRMISTKRLFKLQRKKKMKRKKNTFRKNQNHNWVMLTNNQVSLTHFARCLTLALTHKWSHYTVSSIRLLHFYRQSTVIDCHAAAAERGIEKFHPWKNQASSARQLRRQERTLFFRQTQRWCGKLEQSICLNWARPWSDFRRFCLTFLSRYLAAVEFHLSTLQLAELELSACWVWRQRSDNFTHLDLLHISYILWLEILCFFVVDFSSLARSWFVFLWLVCAAAFCF